MNFGCVKKKNVEKKTLELEALVTVATDATNSIVQSVIRFKLRKRYSSHSLVSTYRSMALDEFLIRQVEYKIVHQQASNEK